MGDTRWRSIRVMYLTMFLCSVGFSIVLSSLWPFILMVDEKSATPSMLGYIVAAFSLGQLIASPLLGFWANRGGSKVPLVASVAINMIGNFMYSYSNAIPGHDNRNGWYMFASRFLVGFGAGVTGVARSFISGSTSYEERTGAMAHMSIAQSLGFILGPALTLVFVPIGETGWSWKAIDLQINMYTVLGFFSGFLALINIIFLLVFFKDQRLSSLELESHESPLLINDPGEKRKKQTAGNKVGVASCLIFFFVILFVFTVFETIATPSTMDEFAWTRKEATLYVGVIFAVSAVIAVAVFLVIKPLSKKINENLLLGAGLIILFFGLFLLLPWGNKYPVVQPALIDPANSSSHGDVSIYQPLNSNIPSMNVTRYSSRGCSLQYHWCETTPKIYLAQFCAAGIVISIGYPIASVTIYVIFSKILGAAPQGTMMGLLTASGSLARTVGPIFVSAVYHQYGPRWTYVSASGIVLVAIVFFLAIFRRMRTVPAL
eukprot:m.123174 g.123174  ORF g.123174 m.123174 type:complete len:489 (+) comp37813_c0_seq2:67-1533(+)